MGNDCRAFVTPQMLPLMCSEFKSKAAKTKPCSHCPLPVYCIAYVWTCSVDGQLTTSLTFHAVFGKTKTRKADNRIL